MLYQAEPRSDMRRPDEAKATPRLIQSPYYPRKPDRSGRMILSLNGKITERGPRAGRLRAFRI